MRFLKGLINSSRFIPFFIICAIIIVDQLSKVLASKYLDVVCNEGFGFGIQIGHRSTSYISFAILAYLIYIILSEKRKNSLVFLSAILGGGASNLIDRTFFGCVRDFINMSVWPSFNLADSAITLGIILYLLQLFKGKKDAA